MKIPIFAVVSYLIASSARASYAVARSLAFVLSPATEQVESAEDRKTRETNSNDWERGASMTMGIVRNATLIGKRGCRQ
jgi:hypothetical protein